MTQRKVKTAASELKLLHKIMHMTNNYNFTISNSHAHLAYFSAFCYSYLVFCHFELMHLTNNYNFTISNSHAHLAYFSAFCYSYLVFCHFELIPLDL